MALLAALLMAGESGAGDIRQLPHAEAVRANGELKVCIWPEYFAITYLNPRSGEVEGIDADLARDLARRLGVPVRFVRTSFRDFMDVLEGGGCHVAMFGIGMTEARAGRIDFAEPYLSSLVYGVTTLNNPVVRTWQDIDRPGNRVAVASGTLMEPLMRRTLMHAEVVSVAPPNTREAELQSGRVDVFMSDYPYTRRLVMLGQAASVIQPPRGFGETRYAHAVAKGDAAMLALMNAFIAAARQDGTLRRAAERHALTPILIE